MTDIKLDETGERKFVVTDEGKLQKDEDDDTQEFEELNFDD
jgi:hypothetical protein